MEKLIDRFSSKVAEELSLDKDKKEVLSYGIFAILNTSISIFLIAVFGIVFKVAIEALIVAFIGSSFRKYSGGVHASSPDRCAAIGTVICVGQALFFVNLIMPIINLTFCLAIGAVVFAIAFYLVNKLAPVDSPSKPIRTEEKRIRMKKGSILSLSVYILISVINISLYTAAGEKRFLAYSLCIYGGVAWQVFTLTRVGHNTINKIDTFLKSIIK